MKKCVFAGTFDPFTVGHADTVAKSLSIFDEVLIVIADNKAKHCRYSAQERLEMIAEVYEDDPRVSVRLWDGTVADLLREEHTPYYVRGLRNTVDFEYETSDFFASRDLNPEMIEIFIPAERPNVYISSTLVKNCMDFGTPYEDYLPEKIFKRLAAQKHTVLNRAERRKLERKDV